MCIRDRPQSRAREVSDPRAFEGYIRQLVSLLPVFQRYYHKKTTTGIRFVLPEGFPPPETAWVREGWIEVRGKNELSINVTSRGLEALDKGFVVALVRWCRVREWARNHGQDGARVVEMSQEEAETVLRGYAKHFPSEEGRVRVEVALERMEGGHAG
jgi:type IV secretion system protein VirD4